MLLKKTTHIIPILGLLLCTAQIQTAQNNDLRKNDDFLAKINGLLNDAMAAETDRDLSIANHELKDLFKGNPQQTNLLLRYQNDERAPYSRFLLQIFNRTLSLIENPTTIEALQEFGFLSTYDPSKLTEEEQKLLDKIIKGINQKINIITIFNIVDHDEDTMASLGRKLNLRESNPLLNAISADTSSMDDYFGLVGLGLINKEAMFDFLSREGLEEKAEELQQYIHEKQL